LPHSSLLISFLSTSSSGSEKNFSNRELSFDHSKNILNHSQLFNRDEYSHTCLQTLLGVAAAVETGLTSHTVQEVEINAAQVIASTNMAGVGLTGEEVEGTVAVPLVGKALWLQLKFFGLDLLLLIYSCSFSLIIRRQGSVVPQPDANVTRIERETEAAAKLARAKLTTQKSKGVIEARLPPRPGFGTKGRPVVLWANYFHMTPIVNQTLYRYSIQVVATQGSKSPSGKKLKRVIQLFIDANLAQSNLAVVTDFKTNLLSKLDLNIGETEYQITYLSEDEDGPAPNAPTYNVRLQPTGTITVSDLLSYLTSTNPGRGFGSKDELIQALNILVGHHPKVANTIASIGSNKHYQLASPAAETYSLGAGLVALRGFFVSVRAATARILVNVQVKHGAFLQAGPLEQLMYAFSEENGPSKVKLDGFLKKASIEVIHIVKTNKAGKRIPRFKTIMSLAKKDDGRGQPNPPIVSEFGAGAKDVKFFLENPPPKSFPKSPAKKGKEPAGRGNAPTASNAPSGKYISVYDFFEQCKTTTARPDLQSPLTI
jgi:eukaryotic translation initiation factor 2C